MIALIAAYAKNRAIGKDGKLPWKLINELHHFRDITAGNIVIMGRKTFESIGKPLKGRTTIVLSKNKIFFEKRQPEAKLYEARSIPESLSLAKTLSAKSDTAKNNKKNTAPFIRFTLPLPYPIFPLYYRMFDRV